MSYENSQDPIRIKLPRYNTTAKYKLPLQSLLKNTRQNLNLRCKEPDLNVTVSVKLFHGRVNAVFLLPPPPPPPYSAVLRPPPPPPTSDQLPLSAPPLRHHRGRRGLRPHAAAPECSPGTCPCLPQLACHTAGRSVGDLDGPLRHRRLRHLVNLSPILM